MDMLNWLCGMQELMVATIQQEDFVGELLEMITCWNIERMRLVLSAPVDLYIKRAWYEGCDFVTPGFYRRQILPRLKREVDLAHEHGAKFGYICSSGLEPMLDLFLEFRNGRAHRHRPAARQAHGPGPGQEAHRRAHLFVGRRIGSYHRRAGL